jgi:hypothetical protein
MIKQDWGRTCRRLAEEWVKFQPDQFKTEKG